MAPRNSVSTRGSCSASTMHSPASFPSSSAQTDDVQESIDPLALDDPAKMSPQAIMAELRYYGIQTPAAINKSTLRRTLSNARRQNAKGRQGVGGGERCEPQAQLPFNVPQHYNSSMRITENDVNASPHLRYDTGTSGLGIKPTFIPLLPGNRIPPQILNILRTSADPTMRAINLNNRNLSDQEVKNLAIALESNSTVTTLSLQNCGITDEGMVGLAEMLIKNKTLVELLLDNNRIGSDGAASLSTAIMINETLVVLTLSGNATLMDLGVVYLMRAFEHNTTICTLDVSNCGDDANAKDRVSQIEEMLADRQIDSNFESLLERLIDDDFHMTGIDLSGRRIGNRGAIRMADAMADNTQVRQLWLRGCNIGSDGARALASCLEQNMSIVDIFLANNAIGDVGLFAISDSLALHNSTLVSLELDNNDIGEDGLEAFVHALETNASMLVASFENNPRLTNSAQMLDELQAKLKAKLEGMNRTCFVVDPDAASRNDDSIGLVNMSICSSYMPSTYRRAGLDSRTGTPAEAPSQTCATDPSKPEVSPDDVLDFPIVTSRKSSNDKNRHQKGVPSHPPLPPYRRQSPPYAQQQQQQQQQTPEQTPKIQNNKNRSQKGAPPPPPPPPPPYRQQSDPYMQQQQQQQQQQLQTPKSRVSPKHQPSKHHPSPVHEESNNRLVLPSKTSPKPARPIPTCPPPTPNALRSSGKSNKWSAASESQYAGRQQSVRKSVPSQSFPKNSRKPSLHVINEHEMRVSDQPPFANTHSPTLPNKSNTRGIFPDHNRSLQILPTNRGIMEEKLSSSDTKLNHKKSSQIHRSKSPRSRSQEVEVNPKCPHSPTTTPLKRSVSSSKKLQKTMETIPKLPLSNDSILMQDSKTIAESIMQPQTQRNFNRTLKNLLHLVELTKRTNTMAAARYSALHFWFYFLPISFCIFSAIVLALIGALHTVEDTRLGLALFSAFFSFVAFLLNFLQGKYSMSTRASLHRSVKAEMVQVAFRLEKLRNFKGWGLSSSKYSTESRANAIRNLYRLDIYVRAMGQCTPPIPTKINDICCLLTSRVKTMCLKYPNTIKERLSYNKEEFGEVPIEMQSDAYDCLEEELRSFFLYPILMPNPQTVVSRTIDVFFSNPLDSRSTDGTEDLEFSRSSILNRN